MTTATETQPKLAWGLSHAVPDSARAAWGARAIIEGAGFGLLHDRQSVWSADPEAKSALLAILNGPHTGDGAIQASMDAVKLLRQGGHICGPNGEGGDDAEEHLLYYDGEVKIVGNTNGSFGYLYIAAWLEG